MRQYWNACVRRVRHAILRRLSTEALDAARIPWSFDIYTWFSELSPSQWVLDIGSGEGSFPSAGGCHFVVLDEDANVLLNALARDQASCHPVLGSAARLPFANASFDLIICHHMLEHTAALEDALSEIARVLRPDGRLYIAVPDGHGLCDAVYRWVFRGGGHVNRFAREPLASLIARSTGLHMARWQKLYSSFVYLRRLMNMQGEFSDLSPRARALRRYPWALGAVQWGLYLGTRIADRLLGANLAVYGWAMYFERSPENCVEDPAYVNVCLHCGTGHHALSVYRPYPCIYRCPVCDHLNPHFEPFRGTA